MLDDLERQATKAQKEGLGDGGGWMEGGGEGRGEGAEVKFISQNYFNHGNIRTLLLKG